jgi:hypothetical protein
MQKFSILFLFSYYSSLRPPILIFCLTLFYFRFFRAFRGYLLKTLTTKNTKGTKGENESKKFSISISFRTFNSC